MVLGRGDPAPNGGGILPKMGGILSPREGGILPKMPQEGAEWGKGRGDPGFLTFTSLH